jgi:hypothetical protein
MSAASTLEDLAKSMEELLPLFVKSSGGLILPTKHQSKFKRLAVEAKAVVDGELGRTNDFSQNLWHAVNGGSDTFFGGPSYARVSEAAEVIRGAVNQIGRRPHAPSVQAPAMLFTPAYVDLSRIRELETTSKSQWDVTRLVQLCRELNLAHQNGCHMTVAMLVRAIVDHVPPIFGCTSFAAVAANYAGTKSFKASMKHLEGSLRNIADAQLHTHIRMKESVPTAAQVDFRGDLDVLLGEVTRVMP